MIGVREGRQTTVNSPQLRERKENPGKDLTQRTQSAQSSLSRSRKSEGEAAWKSGGAEVGDELGGAGGTGSRGLGMLLGRAVDGVFEGGVELAEFGVVGEVEGFEEGFGEIVGLLADLLAAFGGEEELGEVAEGGGAAGGDAVGG